MSGAGAGWWWIAAQYSLTNKIVYNKRALGKIRTEAVDETFYTRQEWFKVLIASSTVSRWASSCSSLLLTVKHLVYLEKKKNSENQKSPTIICSVVSELEVYLRKTEYFTQKHTQSILYRLATSPFQCVMIYIVYKIFVCLYLFIKTKLNSLKKEHSEQFFKYFGG